MKNCFKASYFLIFFMMLQLVIAIPTCIVFSRVCGGSTWETSSILLLIPLIGGPIVLLGRKKLESVFRFTVLYFAYIPTTTLLGGWRELQKNGIDVRLNRQDILDYANKFPKEIILFICFLWILNAMEQIEIGFRKIAYLVVAMILMAMGAVLTSVSDILLYCGMYLVIVVTFELWEHVLDKAKKNEKIVMWILTTVLYLRGCYNMLAILKVY